MSLIIPEAQAQAAEATKVATQAADAYLNNGVLGLTCIVLILAVCVLFWLLVSSFKANAALVERVVVTMEQSKTAADDNEEATKTNTAAITALTAATQALARELDGEVREVRHGINNVLSSVRGIARKLRAMPDTAGQDE